MEGNFVEEQPREIKKRPRPVISCLSCRSKKLKCDRLLPCQQCIKGGRSRLCAYADGQEPELRQDADSHEEPSKRIPALSQTPITGSLPASEQVQELLDRMRLLEKALQEQQAGTQTTRSTSLEASAIGTSELWSTNGEDERSSHVPGNASVLQPFHFARQYTESLPGLSADLELVQIAAHVKILDQSLVRRKARVRSRYTNLEDCLNHMLQLLPSQAICETLINLYFENFEHCIRILHKPTFLEQYRRSLFGQPEDIELKSFLPLLMGVLSIASSLNTLQECELPLLRGDNDGVGATELLRNWLDVRPVPKQLEIPVLQAKLLLLLSMRAQGYDDNSLWLLSGQLVREALIMQLNVAHVHDQDPLTSELCRRLWVTIIEQDLGNAICCRMPVHVPSLQEPLPLNVNDTELSSMSGESLISKPTSEWTDGLCLHVLAQSLNTRLEAYNFSLGCRPSDYEACLERARTLENTLFSLPATFKLDHNNPPGRLMAQIELDITLRRPLVALYTPFAQFMPTDDRYKEARIAWVQSNLVILCFQDLFDPKFPAIEVPRPDGYWDLYYTIYRNDTIRGLRAQLLELQRLRSPSQTASDGSALNLQQHPHRSASRAMPWTLKGMGESVEDTLDPLIRRIGRSVADLGDVFRYQVAYNSLQSEQRTDAEQFVRLGLKTTLHLLLSRLEKEGITLNASAILAAQDPLCAGNTLQWLAGFLNGYNTTNE